MVNLEKKFEKEFDELVNIQKSRLNPSPFKEMLNLFNIFGDNSSKGVDKHLKVLALPYNKYNAVVSAYDAIKMYGKGDIGMKIYNRNKKAYVNICLLNLKNH